MVLWVLLGVKQYSSALKTYNLTKHLEVYIEKNVCGNNILMTIAYFIEKFKLCATCTAVLNYFIILPYISNNVK